MKARFNRHEMAEVLAAICTVAAGRTPKEILRCVKIEAAPDELLLSATDLELGLRCAVRQVEVEETGQTVVVADTLARIVRECTDELLEIETAESLLHVNGEGSHFQIVTQDAAEFPAVAVIKEDVDLTVECGTLRRLTEWTAFASARETTRYAINGVLWEVADGKLVLVATDGRRLSLARGQFTAKREKLSLYAIVPVRTLNLLGRVPLADDTPVSVRLTSNQLVMQAGSVTISSSLVEGHFPKYDDVIPRDNDKRVELNTTQFQGALKRASLLTNEESKGVRLVFSREGLTLSSRAPEQGEATINLPLEYSGETVEIGFNPVFLLDVLRVVESEEVSFSFKEAARPGVFMVGQDFVYVVMPVNLS